MFQNFEKVKKEFLGRSNFRPDRDIPFQKNCWLKSQFLRYCEIIHCLGSIVAEQEKKNLQKIVKIRVVAFRM